jgi:hypothetical protein
MSKKHSSKFSPDLSFMDEDDWKQLKAFDRDQQRRREETKRHLREAKESSHAGLDFDSPLSLRYG